MEQKKTKLWNKWHLVSYVFLDSEVEEKDSAPCDSKHYLTSFYPDFLLESNFKLLGVFPNIRTVPLFQKIYYLTYDVIFFCMPISIHKCIRRSLSIYF